MTRGGCRYLLWGERLVQALRVVHDQTDCSLYMPGGDDITADWVANQNIAYSTRSSGSFSRVEAPERLKHAHVGVVVALLTNRGLGMDLSGVPCITITIFYFQDICRSLKLGKQLLLPSRKQTSSSSLKHLLDLGHPSYYQRPVA